MSVERKCPKCGEQVTGRPNKIYCSSYCYGYEKYKRWLERNRKQIALKTRLKCPVCGELVEGRMAWNRVYCSTSCKQKVAQRTCTRDPKKKAESKRKWYIANRDKVREYMRKYAPKWLAANREKSRQYSRDYCRRNIRTYSREARDKRRERCRKWREKNPEKSRDGCRKWRESNRERYLKTRRDKKRRIRKEQSAAELRLLMTKLQEKLHDLNSPENT